MEITTQRSYSLSPNECQIVARDADDLGYVWFANRRDLDVHYFTLTRSYAEGSVHCERDDQKWQAYGGLLEVDFDGNAVVFRFDESAAEALGGLDTVIVACQLLPPETRLALAHILASLLGGTGVSLNIGRA